MKLTQRTLFQCFEKSRPESTAVNSLSNTSQIKTSSKIQQCQILRADFLRPIHVRQLDSPTTNTSIPLLNERKVDDEEAINCNQEFYRICPTMSNEPIPLPKLQFIEITSIERQKELFEQYTTDASVIDWRTIFEGLQEYRTKAIEQNQYEQLLWTELYRPKTSQTYLGNHTRQIKRLHEWFAYWRNRLQNEQPRQILSKKRKRLSDDEDDEDFTENSNLSHDTFHYSKPEHPQLIFIHGSGTTSLVHALAEEHNFKMTEINGSQSRARAPLLKQLEQVNSHHHLAFKRCPSDSIASQGEQLPPHSSSRFEDKSNKESFSPLPMKKKVKNECGSIMSYFNQPKKSIDNQKDKENKSRRRSKELIAEKDDSKILINETNLPKKRRSKTSKQERSPIVNDNHFLSSVQVEKTSFILFDEIETLTTDDNFWSCLKKLLETAKKPIILTSNSRVNPEEAIINLSKLGYYELVHLEANEPELICCFLRVLLLTEMFEIPSLDELASLVRLCSSDLRQTLSTLQFLVQSSMIERPSKAVPEEKETIVSQAKWQSSPMFDAMYYSRLAEQWTESPLKIFFDDLTKKCTSEYDQSHRLLINQSRNNAKRMELYDTFKLFMQEEEIENIIDQSSFYLDYRPYIRQICQNEQIRAEESTCHRRLRHHLSFRGCSLQWSDFEVLSTGLD